MIVESRWKRKLRSIGFEGSISAWPDSQGTDLSIEAVPEAKGPLKSIQTVFKIGPSDSRTAKELLKDFSACLAAVYSEAQEQVLAEADSR